MKNEFTQFWGGLTPTEKAELAKRAGTSVGYLAQVATGHRNAGTKTISSLCAADERITLAMFFETA